MNQKGFTPVIVVLIGIILVSLFLLIPKNKSFQGPINSVSSPTSTNTSDIVIPNVIDQWLPNVTWEKTVTGNFQVGSMEKPAYGIERKGAILSSDLNPYNLNIDSRISSLNWVEKPPIGASGPAMYVQTFVGNKNGIDKTLVIIVENLDNVKNLTNYRNLITVFQEL